MLICRAVWQITLVGDALAQLMKISDNCTFGGKPGRLPQTEKGSKDYARKYLLTTNIEIVLLRADDKLNARAAY
jgi:hypothetical protein